MTAYEEVYRGRRVCCTCAFYTQHYRQDKKGTYSPVAWGHCVVGHVKPRTPEQTCERWREREDG